jgi:hypothetical protein
MVDSYLVRARVLKPFAQCLLVKDTELVRLAEALNDYPQKHEPNLRTAKNGHTPFRCQQ